MSAPRLFVLLDDDIRARCAQFVLHDAPDRWHVLCREEPMHEGQKKRFHAMCGELAKSGIEWMGSQRTAAEWKVLLISGHKQATGGAPELIQGLEGEFVDIRESVTSMSRQRGASLITYGQAFCDLHGVVLKK